MFDPRRPSAIAWFVLAAALIGLAAASPAAAQGTTASRTPISELQAAQLLFKAGHLAEAKRVLADLERASPNDNEVQFLLGLVSVEEKNYADAIHRFRAILVREPKAARVRLELARAFFLAKDYDNAERQFRLARAGDLSPAVEANIDQYLGAIRRQRRWSYNLSLALVPDTNEGAGPNVGTVSLFGLPFELSASARQHSGLGAAVDAGAEWSPPITKTVRARVGLQLDSIDYGQTAFDDTTLAAYVGPQFLGKRWDVSPLAAGFERWYGGRFYNEGLGGSLQGDFYPMSRLGLNGVIGVQTVSFRPPKSQDGLSLSGSLGFLYTLDVRSAVSGGVSVSRQQAQSAVFANTASQVRLGYACDLPFGYSVLIQPSYAWIDYDQAEAAFGVRRRDRQWQGQVSILNRRIDIYGFTPQLSYIHTQNASDIRLYAYERDQIRIGVTRQF